MFDPWLKTVLRTPPGWGAPRSFQVPHGVFSTQAIDAGTQLLLAHLPEGLKDGRSKALLEIGCGYGALGLPLAAARPEARLELVDRDLLAVHFCRLNAEAQGLSNVRVHGSLGFRDLLPGGAPFDGILCNVPARAGRNFFAELFERGETLLAPGGEVRVVILRALLPVLEELALERGLPLREIATGPAHAIVTLERRSPQVTKAVPFADDPLALYGLSEVTLGGLTLARPHDLGGDDPARTKAGLPLLWDALPKVGDFQRVLCWRGGYGLLPLEARRRYPGAGVVSIDRDLLASTFTRLNADRLSLGGPLLDVREAYHAPLALKEGERFDLALGELLPSGGIAVAESELVALANHLAPGGSALILVLEKLERSWIEPIAARRKLRLVRLATRGGWSVVRLAR